MADAHSPLESEIRRLIAVAGPMPIAEYMRLCLTHPRYGYYINRDPLGAGGDFTTSPEISQMFGELIGLWMAAVWRQMREPENVRIVELGCAPPKSWTASAARSSCIWSRSARHCNRSRSGDWKISTCR